jgi:hypothetical protein
VPPTKNDRLANCPSVVTTLQDSQLRLTTSLSFTQACGYQLFSPEIEDDVIPCYGAIQLLHKKIKMAWTNTRTLQSGPLVERILEKGLAVLPKLRQVIGRRCPFMNVNVFSRSRLRTSCQSCRLTRCVLPTTTKVFFHQASAPMYIANAASRCSESCHDSFPSMTTELVRRSPAYATHCATDRLFVPGFDPTVPIAQSVWTSDSSILDFCQGHMLYFRLQAKKNMFFSSREYTTIILCAVTHQSTPTL